MDFTKRKSISDGTKYIDLLVPIFRNGKLVYEAPAAPRIKEHQRSQLAHFHAGIKRLIHAHSYPVGLEERLHALRTDIVMHARGIEARGRAKNNRRDAPSEIAVD